MRQRATLWIFWAAVLLLPMSTGLFHASQYEGSKPFLDSVRLALSAFGYCLLIGLAGPRVLDMLKAFEGSQQNATERNKLWFERSLMAGLCFAAVVLWPRFSW